jgi:hypothetical protein
MQQPWTVRAIRWFAGTAVASILVAILVATILSVNFEDVHARNLTIGDIDRSDVRAGMLISVVDPDHPASSIPLCTYTEIGEITRRFGPNHRSFYNILGEAVNTSAVMERLLGDNRPLRTRITLVYDLEVLRVNHRQPLDETCVGQVEAALNRLEHVCVVSDALRMTDGDQLIGIRFNRYAVNTGADGARVECPVYARGWWLWPIKRHLIGLDTTFRPEPEGMGPFEAAALATGPDRLRN